MGTMNRRTWQRAEERAAHLFGARRNVLSGGSNRDDRSRSDATHERLFLETKHRTSHAAQTLHDQTKALAKKEGKVPVLCLSTKGRPGVLVVVHSSDLPAMLEEYRLALEEEERLAIGSQPGEEDGFRLTGNDAR